MGAIGLGEASEYQGYDTLIPYTQCRMHIMYETRSTLAEWKRKEPDLHGHHGYVIPTVYFNPALGCRGM